MYIEKADYKSRISTDLLDKIITEGDDTGDDILTAASKMAEDTIATQAGVLYDILPEFDKTGLQRNHLIVKWALSLAVYEAIQRLDDESIPDKHIKNHDDTMDDLKQVALGKYPLNLPPRPPDTVGHKGGDGDETVITEGKGLRRVGSQAKRSQRV
jgi:hypothetical protein